MTWRTTGLAFIAASSLFVACGGDDGYDGYSNNNGGNYGEPIDEDASNEGDNYQAVGTNPFTVVSHDPRSTFAADVDTASYDIFVRDIESGALPQPDSVRLEEYVNFFRYDYEAPLEDAEHPFALHLDAVPSMLNGTTILRVGMQAVQPPPEEKKPTNLVFLVDISGSMTSSTKLPLVKQVLTETLDLLDPTDTISIVTYAGSTGVALPATPVSERGKIEDVIDSFSAGGSTAGAAGIDLAYAEAEEAFRDGGVNHVLLCTDGDFNVGPSSTDALVELIEEKRETGIEMISNKGNGIYGVISSSESASQYVEERMLSSFNLIAKDVKLQVEFNPEHVYAYRLLGYENRAIDDDDFREDAVDAGEIGAGHQVTALYELVLAGDELPAVLDAPEAIDGEAYTGEVEVEATDFALVKIRYKQPSASSEDPATEVGAGIAPADIKAELGEADADVSWAVAIAAFAEILKDSPYANPEALPTIAEIVNGYSGTDGHRQSFASYLETATELLSL
jgi:Ca-activated chloride channel family protein